MPHSSSRSDSAGAFRIAGLGAGAIDLQIRRLGYAATRVHVVVLPNATTTVEVLLRESALSIPGVIVTAESRKSSGETAPADIIDRDAIWAQSATSLAGILELIPGVPLSPPGLEGAQQIAIRTNPVSMTGASASSVGSFGTLIILDGVPLSNNANLQASAERSSVPSGSIVGGGIDLRTIPAATLERVEVIRGLPPVRYGDLTQGTIIVETRAAEVAPEGIARYDPQTIETAGVGGWKIRTQTLTGSIDVARTKVAPALRDDEARRITAGIAHRYEFASQRGALRGALLSSRADLFVLRESAPELPAVRPGYSLSSRDSHVRLMQRLTVGRRDGWAGELTWSASRTAQALETTRLLSRGASPFTDRLDEGRSYGSFIGGNYLSRLEIDGAPWMFYSRAEVTRALPGQRVAQRLRLGSEVRREGQSGAGYQFDMRFPPQSTFNGILGYTRPRSFETLPRFGVISLYADDRAQWSFGGTRTLEVQGGVRLDMLRTHAIESRGAAVWQPRFHAELAPARLLRIHGSAGRTAKMPALTDLAPTANYFDIVNVNYYANDPAERLAVLTTFIRYPNNPELRPVTSTKWETGIDVGSSRTGVRLTWFDESVANGITRREVPGFVLRDYYDLTNVNPGSGTPPQIVDPPSSTDTIPIVVDQPANILSMRTTGLEGTVMFPAIPVVGTRIEMQGVWARTKLARNAPDLGSFGSAFQSFQSGLAERAPYWPGLERVGRRDMITTRLIQQHAPSRFILTLTVQHYLKDRTHDIGAKDTLQFAGYITRSGELVEVDPAMRTDPQYQDLRRPRTNLLARPIEQRPDWLASVQISKAILSNGRISFYAFNALNRSGRYDITGQQGRPLAPIRFGTELALPWPR